MSLPNAPSQTWTFHDGDWHEGNYPLAGARTHAFWLGSSVFDGARAFEGVTPDLDRHCERINESARKLGLEPCVPLDTWLGLVRDGIKRFGHHPELYIRPMYWGELDGLAALAPDPFGTRWALTLWEAPLPPPGETSITLSPFRRPTLETMPVNIKSGCLYPNNARAVTEAARRGFDNCLLRDMLGNVAELATANIFMAAGGTVFTPAANGTFLNGITRQRVIGLLRQAGVTVQEAVLKYEDFLQADEIWSAGNFGKVRPVTRIDDRRLAPGPFYQKARDLYWQFAHG